MDGAFHEWFHKILPKLDPHVTVMDNASHKTEKTETLLTSQNSKWILYWFKSKDMPLDSKQLLGLYLNTLVFMQNNMTKAQNVTALLFLLHH
jgi:hypothetical protein